MSTGKTVGPWRALPGQRGCVRQHDFFTLPLLVHPGASGLHWPL